MLLTNNNHSTSESESTALSNLQQIDSVAPHHYSEFKNSAISDTLIKLNFRTITDSREVDKILNLNNRKRWKHSDDLVPAWYAAGIDPLTDEPTLQGVQVKPDKTPIGKDGKPQKYKSAKEFDTAPLFLNTGIPGYWKSIFDDVLVPMLIAEGVKKAASGLSIDLPTISIPGVTTCRKKGRLHPLLAHYAVLGRTFYLAFDNDILKKKPVQNALIGLARELAARGSKIMVIMLPSGEAKGMDDYIFLHGEEAFKELIKNALTFEEWKEYIDAEESEDTDKRKSKVARSFQLINERWGNDLTYNTLKKRVELNGTELSADDVRLSVALEFDVDMSATDAHTIIRTIAKSNSYSPVVDYLDEVEAKYPNLDTSYLDNLANEYFGTKDPMHSIYFKKFLVAAVARARKPGEKVDSVFMLASQKQGLYKSTFFRVLFGDDWFSDQLGDASDKDERQKMHRFWCLEWAEFEHVYKRKDVSTLKNFITAVEDTFRAPYDREPITYPRSCIFVGTTNEQEILNDPTGDRRFWIVPVSKRIDLFKVIRDRDKIWATANALFKAGCEWKLTDEEEERREILNRSYHSVDPWLEIIESHIESDRLKFITTENLYSLLNIEPAKRTGAEARRISGVMRRLGWNSIRTKIHGVWRRGYCVDGYDPSPTENSNTKDVLENLSGSSGSNFESPIVQGVLADPDKKSYLDLSGSKGSVFPQESNTTHQIQDIHTGSDLPFPVLNNTKTEILIPQIQIDPDAKSYLDQLEPSPCLGDPDDPDKTVILTKTHTFFDQSTPIEEKGDRTKPTCQPCPITKKQMPAEFELTVKEKLVKFVPISFKRGGKSLRFVLYIEDRQFNTSIDWPVSKEQMILDLEAIASGFIRRYF